jgi:nucleotide-binding universal stress UspA family protein
LAGYDGSPSSRHALAYAAGMARRLGRPLVLVYVCPGVYCEPLSGQVIGAARDEAELGRWLMAELIQVTDPDDLVVRGILRRGNPARELGRRGGRGQRRDALVVGAPGRAWHHVAGSVPGWLSRHANCPVIVVPCNSASRSLAGRWNALPALLAARLRGPLEGAGLLC